MFSKHMDMQNTWMFSPKVLTKASNGNGAKKQKEKK
jgi:hypothetical protein